MTRSAIEKELGEHMNEPPADARDLVYALIKIRKVLEHDKQKRAYWTLTLFCDWILHTELLGDGAKKILEMLDKRLGGFNPSTPESIDPDGMVHKILSFDLFRGHLWDFLRRNHLPTVWAEDEFAWKKTVLLYGEQVHDTPLVMTRKSYKFKYLRRLVIAACEPAEEIVEANPTQKHYGFKWQFTLNDGRTFQIPYTSNVPEQPPNWRTQGTRQR